ncbi:monoacylglycerol lipase [Spirochaetia bacterium]|nr:monoacylglycerol lipase [Spirochaetia bacterium]
MNITETKIQTYDGVKLYMKAEIPGGARAIVLIVHGLAEHHGRYDYVAERIGAAGAAVFRFDHRGHGNSDAYEGRRVHYTDYKQIAEDIKAAASYAVSACPGLKLFLAGHSMGGYGTAMFATMYPELVSGGVILSGALTRYNLKLFGDLPMKQAPSEYLPNELADGLCSNPEVLKALETDTLHEKKIGVSLVNTFKDGVAYLAANGRRFTAPVLVMHGADDGLVSEKDSRDFYGDIASKDKSLIIYSKLQHEIFNEIGREKVLDDLVYWLKGRV